MRRFRARGRDVLVFLGWQDGRNLERIVDTLIAGW